jgi:hypothetical protein
VNQLGAEFIFESGDLFADGRLTNSTFLRDSGEAPFSITPTNACIASNLSMPVSYSSMEWILC